METLTFPTPGSPPRFNFGQSYYDSENPSSASTPFVSAPSSPGRNGPAGLYFSAPTSPNWAARIALHETSHNARKDSTDGHPFSWEETPGTPKKGGGEGTEEVKSLSLEGCEFEFSARFSVTEDPPMSPTPMSSANELFFNGQIRPLRPPPRLQHPPHVRVPRATESSKGGSFDLRSNASSTLSAPQSPRSPLKQGQLNLIKGALCGMSNPADSVLDPFTVAMEEMTKRDYDGKHRRTRSLSPLRIFHWDEEPAKPWDCEEFLRSSTQSSNDEKEPRKDSKRSSPKTSKRWSLKDLLHRSKSEGTSHSRESSRRSTDLLPREKQSLRGSGRSDGSDYSRESSSRGKDSARNSVDEGKKARNPAPMNGAALRIKAPQRSPRGGVSPHELYTMQKAQTEEMRKKTYLPYRQGLLGCLGITSKSYRTMTSMSKSLQPVS